MAAVPDNVTVPRWVDANRDCLAKELQRIRLLMRRQACWCARRGAKMRSPRLEGWSSATPARIVAGPRAN